MKTYPLVVAFCCAWCTWAADSIQFAESYSENVLSVMNEPPTPGWGSRDVHYEVVTADAFYGMATVTLPGLAQTQFTDSAEFGFAFGDLGFFGTAGGADVKTTNSWTFHFTCQDCDTGRITGNGKVIFTRNRDVASVALSFHSVSSIFANKHLKTNEVFQGETLFGLIMGDFFVEKPIYYKGTAKANGKTVFTAVDRLTYKLSTVQITGEADFTRPTVAITSRMANSRTENEVAVVVLRATDNIGVRTVGVRLNDDDEFTPAERAEGLKNTWLAELNLAPGTNVIHAVSTDLAGNVSRESTVKVFYVVKSPIELLVEPEEGGMIIGISNGQMLELGRGYSVWARPANGYAFAAWSDGNGETTRDRLGFIMEEGMSLQAIFVPNPFLDFGGSYKGLFHSIDEKSVSPTNSGFLELTLTDQGWASGTVLLGRQTYRFSGVRFMPQSCNCGVNVAFQVPRQAPLPPLQFDVYASMGFIYPEIEGTVTDGQWESALKISRVAPQTDLVGNYTFAFPYQALVPLAGGDNRDLPRGSGAGTISVDAKGVVQLIGSLGDGTLVTCSSGVSEDGKWPVYALLQQGKGMLIGWGQFVINDAIPNRPTIEGPITWIKSPVSADKEKYYPQGFAALTQIYGARYMAPQQGQPVLNWTSGLLEMDGGNLLEPIQSPVQLVTNQLVILDNTHNLSLTFMPKSGLVSGSFVHPSSKRMAAIKGALIQWPDSEYEAGGWFLGPSQSGFLFLGTNQPSPTP
jgi:hypothetical protein